VQKEKLMKDTYKILGAEEKRIEKRAVAKVKREEKWAK